MPSGDFSYADRDPDGPAHRRGSGLNPGNRFERYRLHVLGEELDARHAERLSADAPDKLRRIETQLIPDQTRRIINKVAPLADVPFDYTLNPYRGCEHGCVYCYPHPNYTRGPESPR